MVTHPAHPGRVLVEAADVTAGRLPASMACHRRALDAVVAWAWQYLAQPHAELGRRGHVCPYARSSLDAGHFYLAVHTGRPGGPADVADLLRGYRRWFADLHPQHGPDSQLKAVLVLFPDLTGQADWKRVIDGTQRLLKSEFVGHGLMLGEFHDGPPDRPGLWSADFRPLRSPVPLLAIRNMVPTDLAFLTADGEHLAAYLARFGDQVPQAMRQRLRAAMIRLGIPTAEAVT